MRPVVVIPADVKLMNMTTWVLGAAFVVLCLMTATRTLARLPAFDIKGIFVGGQVSHLNAATLRANVTTHLAGTFFTVDLARVRAAFEAVPWVRRAVVRRDFPNRLRVDLQEHQAVAYWGTDSEPRLLNSFGEVFEANLGEIEQDMLPRLNGPDGQAADVWAMYRQINGLFSEMDLTIEALELSKGGSWKVFLDTGAVVELGRGNAAEVMARVTRFLETLTQVVSRYGRKPAAVESADLRHDNGYAIRMQGVTTVVPVVPKK